MDWAKTKHLHFYQWTPPTAHWLIPMMLPMLRPWTIQHSNPSLPHHQLQSIHLSAPILLELSVDAICHSPQPILSSNQQTAKHQVDLQAPCTPTTHKHQLLQKQQKKKLKNHYILINTATRQQSPQQHLSSTIWNQEDTQSTNIKPRQPLIVRVIHKSNTNEKQLRSPTQSATTPITHSMPTIVPNAGHSSKAELYCP